MRLHTSHGSILVDVRHRLKLFFVPDASNAADAMHPALTNAWQGLVLLVQPVHARPLKVLRSVLSEAQLCGCQAQFSAARLSLGAASLRPPRNGEVFGQRCSEGNVARYTAI